MPNCHEQVETILRNNPREVRFAAYKYRAIGFKVSRTTINRLAHRLACNGIDWKRAATREALYQLHMILDPEYMPDCAKQAPFLIGM